MVGTHHGHKYYDSQKVSAAAGFSSYKMASPSKARFPWSVFWSGFGADFVRALSSPGKALPGEDKSRTKSAPKPLQNTLHVKRA